MNVTAYGIEEESLDGMLGTAVEEAVLPRGHKLRTSRARRIRGEPKVPA